VISFDCSLPTVSWLITNSVLAHYQQCPGSLTTVSWLITNSVLIYNLPETIRESDISKLSFAVELAQGLYDRYASSAATHAESSGGGGTGHGHEGQLGKPDGGGTHAGSFEPGAMLWLIQRDFLQVK
jgi:hypothetical protein